MPLAGSTDAPFGQDQPWKAMQAAVERRSAGGRSLGPEESLAPEQALALFTSPLRTPGKGQTRIEIGIVADLCLLERPWNAVRAELGAVRLRLTLRAGKPIWGA